MRVNQLKAAILVIKTAFSNCKSDSACKKPASVSERIGPDQRFLIHVVHTKRARTNLVVEKIKRFGNRLPSDGHDAHDIRWLCAGQKLEL